MASSHSPRPLITHMYTADPSAHVFDGRIYIYPSHDRESDIPFNDNGDQYDMADYHVFSLDSLDPESNSSTSASPPETAQTSPHHKTFHPPDSALPLTDHGTVLTTADVPWASRQLWAPDACRSPYDGKYHLFFPARSKVDDRFRIGVAVSDSPAGPFVAEPEPIEGSFSIDPAVFVDYQRGKGQDGIDQEAKVYLYFGGLWGGQLQCYQDSVTTTVRDGEAEVKMQTPTFDPSWAGPQEPSGADQAALFPKVALLDRSLKYFVPLPISGAAATKSEEGGEEQEPASPTLSLVHDLIILCPSTNLPIPASDHSRRFFEAAWCHRRAKTGVYYFSYSTGDTHLLCYATSTSPMGPFTYRGVLMGDHGSGWTTHHSVVEWPKGSDRWWLFYHDCELSGGESHLRNVKVREMRYGEGGEIELL